jgi:hypothetical protein
MSRSAAQAVPMCFGSIVMERVKGIEPSYEAWEAAVLPLNYTRVGGQYSLPRAMTVPASLLCRAKLAGAAVPDRCASGRRYAVIRGGFRDSRHVFGIQDAWLRENADNRARNMAACLS